MVWQFVEVCEANVIVITEYSNRLVISFKTFCILAISEFAYFY